MLLVHVSKLTNRLGYTLGVVLQNMLHLEFSITTDEVTYNAFNGPKMHYGSEPLNEGLFLQSSHLLMETIIESQELRYDEIDGLPIIFPVYNKQSILSFDILAATFYMVSRYEEYLPHHHDEHGRFCTQESLAYQRGFIKTAIVDRWALLLKKKLQEHYPDLRFGTRNYEFVQTIDIDAAYCYLHKGLFRSITGLLRDAFSRHDMEEVKRRIRVLRHKEDDPFDTFDFIIEQSHQYKNKRLIFFVLIGDYSMYDKPASHHNESFKELLKHLADHAKLGLHPTYNTIEEPERIEKEAKRLSNIVHRNVKRSRFHFLRMQLPQSYTNLIQQNIFNDYSMGFADTSGFRAGTCTSYPFYDLTHDQETSLIIHPFCTMDTTMHTHQKMSIEQAWAEYKQLIDETREVGGTFCAIWHNQNLCDLYGWDGWKELYLKVVDYATY